ncbi:11625_t:CDS:10, partial [Funneliformis mosseae]
GALIATVISECCLLYDQNVRYGKLEPYTTMVISECCLLYGHIFINCNNFLDVNAFWNKIELNKQLQNQLQTAGVVEATSSLISIFIKTFVTAIENVHSAIENINDTLTITGAENTNKRPAEEPSPIITPPSNLRNRSPSPSSTEASPKTNDHNESDVEITRKEDDNPFKARTVEDSTKYKIVLSWSHAINNVIINNVSENDWVTRNGHNISIDFRNFQLKSIEKLEANLTLSYAKEFDLILYTWNEARPRSLVSKMLPTVAHLVIIEYNMLLNERPSLNTSFTYLSSVSYNESKKLDKDTFIHRYCHQILEEIFNTTELSLVWVNGESKSSKERRLLDGHNHGRKLNFWIITKIDDTNRKLIFGEIKPLHCTKTINKSIIKLAEFMKGSLD